MREFPRLQKRGLIEAESVVLSRAAFSRFPRLQKRGLIEARGPSIPATPQTPFPRLQKRGLIEAFHPTPPLGTLPAYFRAFKSAVSLKHRAPRDAE